MNITKIEYESNLNKALNKILNKDKNKIYIKPKNTLLKSFQMNAPNKNRIEKEKESSIMNSLYIPTKKNYQSIIINNNNSDNLIMYNINNNTSRSNDNEKINESKFLSQGTFLNTMKYLDLSRNIDNNNINNNINNNKNNRSLVFKKKTLKNTFSINKRKRNDSNHSIIERSNFQIISDKIYDNSIDENNHINNNNTIANYNETINNKISFDNISEIKVKRKNNYINYDKISNIIMDKLNNHKIINSEETVKKFKSNFNDKNLMILNDNPKNQKENKIQRLLTISRLMKKDRHKILISKFNENFNINTENNNEYNTEYIIKDKRKNLTLMEKESPYHSMNLISSNKSEKKNKNIFEKKGKEIYLVHNSGKKVKVYKNVYNNKPSDNLNGKINFKNNILYPIRKNDQNYQKIAYNNHKEPKTQRQMEIFNKMICKILNK